MTFRSANRAQGSINMTTTEPDFTLANHGSILLLTPVSAAAKAWAEEHLPEDAMRWAEESFVVEHRYIGAILNAIGLDGFTVKATVT